MGICHCWVAVFHSFISKMILNFTCAQSTKGSMVCVYADDAMVFAWMLTVRVANIKNLSPGYLSWWDPKLCDLCCVALSEEGL